MGSVVAVLQAALEIADTILMVAAIITEIVGMMLATVDVLVVQDRDVVAVVARIRMIPVQRSYLSY
jgi:hypothetical protein